MGSVDSAQLLLYVDHNIQVYNIAIVCFHAASCHQISYYAIYKPHQQ